MKARQQRRQRAQRKRQRRVHAQPPRHLQGLRTHRLLQRVKVIQQPAAFGVVGPAGIGQTHAARGALDQHRTQLCLQRAHCLLSAAEERSSASAALAMLPSSTMRLKARKGVSESMEEKAKNWAAA
jgi:hypothetical protein